MKIINQFGAKSYSQDRINLIFNEVRGISSSDFDKMILHFVGGSKAAPLVPDFRQAIRDLNIRSLGVAKEPTTQSANNSMDWEYPVKENVWANRNYFFFRGGKYHRFLIKDMCEDRQLLEEDAIARSTHLIALISAAQKGNYTEVYQAFRRQFG